MTSHMTSQELRQKFINFFKKHPELPHQEIPSASLVPSEEEQLAGKEKVLFTSAGMQPLIPYLTGQKEPPSKRLVDVQKCLRTDDIEEVGDEVHHTFFEMLGNWSIGDYWKDEAIRLSFDFLTKELEIPIEKLAITVFAGDGDAPKDEESARIWKSLGIPQERIFYFGKEHNWWPTGQNSFGPCGPDTEMFYWIGEGAPEGKPNEDPGWVEIWNDVFMEFNRKEDGTLEDLPQKNVDTGMGLERTLAVLNGKCDDYETDLFLPIIQTIEEINGKRYNENKQVFRIIADHIKAAVFLIDTNVFPSNKTQGYILRRLIRRSVTKAQLLTQEGDVESLLLAVSESVLKIYKDFYFGNAQHERIQKVIKEEISRFNKILHEGLRMIDRTKVIISDIEDEIPLFITRIIEDLESLQKTVNFINQNRFVKNMSLLLTTFGLVDSFLIEEQQEKLHKLTELAISSGMTPSFRLEDQMKERINPTPETLKEIKGILDYFALHPVTMNSEWVFRFITTFGMPLEVLESIVQEKGLSIDTSEIKDLLIEHQKLSQTASAGMFKGGLADRSEIVTKYHTATHLLHQALRDVLGPEVFQKGSNITSERLRFDFSFDRKMTDDEIKQVEDLVNKKIEEDLKVDRKIVTPEEAKKMNAIGLFDEKYGTEVSIYGIGPNYILDPVAKDQRDRGYYSLEICGGPHVEHTGVIGKIQITKEEAVSAGIRRIRAEIVLR